MHRKAVKIDEESIKLISLFNNLTGAVVKDCIVVPGKMGVRDKVIFLVLKEDVGKAIGRNGENVKVLKEKLQKTIDIIGFSEDIKEFIQNILNTSKVRNVEIRENISGKKTIIITVNPEDKGKAIGKNGIMIKKTKLLVLRHFNVDNCIINTKN
ncbi:MAG: NusA-like transcription termination signal-binding factor [Candidatus Lokiarchaeota archaeon]|nr:NusA-like transcription termination signal-binding factor [Candidatus Lokiarchaeota archaeon]